MLKDQILYTLIDDYKQTLKADCSVWNLRGKCLAATCANVDGVRVDVEKFLQMAEYRDTQVTERNACFTMHDEEQISAIFAIHAAMENIEIIGKLCVSQLEAANRLQEKRLDKNRFFQQLFLDNLLLVDIYNQAKKLNIETEAKREIFVIEPKRQRDSLVLETIKTLYADDYVTSIDEEHVILIKTLEDSEDYQDVSDIARTIVDVLGTEAMVDVRVAYGNIVTKLKDVSKCYKEASMALDVGKVFYVEKNVLAYNELGIGRLIHQLPVSLCEMFLQEVFDENALPQLDEETLMTVNAFFENNLNISETARQIYLHRNTLGYRLEKIVKMTGLDVRKFDDALTFKIALMVADHLKFIKSQE